MSADLTRTLASFLAGVRYEALPIAVVERTEELFLDWLASCLLSRPFDLDGAARCGDGNILLTRRVI